MQVACQNLGPLGKGGVVVGIDTKVVSFSYVSPLYLRKGVLLFSYVFCVKFYSQVTIFLVFRVRI